LEKNGTWTLVHPPPGVNIVGSKWVFRAKRDATGNIVRHKARLVAQGFSQVPGVDYLDTFAPVAKLPSIRTVLTLAARNDLEIHQIDIKGTYLNGELTEKEQIYMCQPPGFSAPNLKGLVCRLQKTLYGLKQSSRRWYQKLMEILVDRMGLTQCNVDQAVFFRHGKDGDIVVVVVHVDDCTITALSLGLLQKFKTEIQKYVEITDLGELHWLLGIEICWVREDRTISLSQTSYIDAIVHCFGLEDLRPVSSPMDPQIRLASAQSPTTAHDFALMQNIPY
jgi:hypothetical protein